MSRLVVFGFAVDWQHDGLLQAASEAGSQIVYWAGCSPEIEKNCKNAFPDFIPNDSINEATICNPESAPLLDVQKILSPHLDKLWLAYLKILRSSTLRTAGIDARTDFLRSVSLAYNIVKITKPDAVIFSNVPTGFIAYCVYICAKYLNIQTLIMKRILFPDHYDLSYIVEDTEFQSTQIIRDFERAKANPAYCANFETPEWLSSHFTNLRGATNASDIMPDYFVLKDKIKTDSQEIERHKTNWFGAITNSILRRREGLELFGGKDGLPHAIRRRQLIKGYEALCEEIDFERKYVYVPLHMQPEASTMPNGGIFAYQLFMVDLLSKSVPHDWIVYVRDHPSQLYFYYPDKLHRTTALYEQICSYPNVRLVSARASNVELTRNASALATITGYAGWEAINWRIPVLLFGGAWYAGCDGVKSARTAQETKAAFAAIEDGYRPALDRIEIFAKVVLQNAIQGEYRTQFQDPNDPVHLSAAQLCRKIVECLSETATRDVAVSNES
ncbi:MAG: hypothetical protein HKN28_04075 [Alphaproteobacteria bacterium]|nr:hypothetical protein [Alphaproteobacteria bacterium]